VSLVPPERKVEPLPEPDRLDSWKEIAAYLNRSERTVRRWEATDELPVHRLQHDKRGSVYAYTRELDAWRVSRRVIDDAPEEAPPPGWRIHRGWGAAGALTLIALAAAIVVGIRQREADATLAAERGTRNEAAWLLYERSRFGDNAGRVQIETGIRYLREAVQLDPEFALAWARLGTAHVALTWFGEQPPSDTMVAARRYAEQARQIDPALGTPWRALGFVSHYLDWNHVRAETEFRRAIALTPDTFAFSWFGDFLADMRRFDEARAAYTSSQAANPRWLEPAILAANILTFTGQPTLAIVEQQRTLETEPNYGLGNLFLGRSYLASGDWPKAIAYMRKANDIIGSVPMTLGDLGFALASGGHREEAERLLQELKSRRDRDYYPAFPIAEIELGLGHTNAALDWFERAVDERHTGWYSPSVDPIWNAIRDTPRFRAQMAKMNLPGS
jgi:tetratricopeptide (TPR) repeat protein